MQCAAHISPNYHYGKEKENINRLQYLKINQKINGRSYFGSFSSHSPVHLDPSPKTFMSTKLKEQYLKCAVPSYQRWSSFPKKKEGNWEFQRIWTEFVAWRGQHLGEHQRHTERRARHSKRHCERCFGTNQYPILSKTIVSIVIGHNTRRPSLRRLTS